MYRLTSWIAGASLALAAGTAAAWPTKPVTLIVPYPPGGGTDIIARIVQEPLSKQLEQPVIIENRGGAGGSIGTAVAAKAAPDGHTLLLTLSSHSINPAIYKNLPFDTEHDFRPISVVASLPQLFAVNPATPYKSLKELIGYMRENPGKIDYASVGIGSPSHMAGELLKMRLNLYMVHIPYRGGGPAVAATMAGDVPLLIVSIPAAMAQVRSGRLRPLAVSTKRRTPILPDVPTVAEATGLRDFEVDSWYALFAPAKTPDEVVARVNKEIAVVVSRADVKAKLLEQGADGVSTTPEMLGNMVRREIAEWRTVVKRAGIEGE
ncbi:MAG TPA: tripartite tricarboxylate transporter substrate binding protein [Burkholderiales bacterium]|nr:tripartite tricarboxylate transporter substrate binding protein [Burkholderiales bacterium]